MYIGTLLADCIPRARTGRGGRTTPALWAPPLPPDPPPPPIITLPQKAQAPTRRPAVYGDPAPYRAFAFPSLCWASPFSSSLPLAKSRFSPFHPGRGSIRCRYNVRATPRAPADSRLCPFAVVILFAGARVSQDGGPRGEAQWGTIGPAPEVRHSLTHSQVDRQYPFGVPGQTVGEVNRSADPQDCGRAAFTPELSTPFRTPTRRIGGRAKRVCIAAPPLLVAGVNLA
jgi:hypothetical protein